MTEFGNLNHNPMRSLYYLILTCLLMPIGIAAQYDAKRGLVVLPPSANAPRAYDGWESMSHIKTEVEASYHYPYAIEVISGNGEVKSVSERGRFEITVSRINDSFFEFLIVDYSRLKERRIVAELLLNSDVRTYKTDDGTIITTTVSPKLMASGYGKNGGSILVKTKSGINEYILHAPNPKRIKFKERYKEELPTEENIYVEGKIKELQDYEHKYGRLISLSRSGKHWVKTYKRKGKYYTVYSSGVVEQY